MNAYEFEKLRELPLDLFGSGGKLKHAGNIPALAIIADEVLPPPVPPATPADIPLAEHYKRKYLTQVTYPKVVCYPHGELSEQVALKETDVSDDRRDVTSIARGQRLYKLTSFNGKELRAGYLCTVHYGPWSAIVEESGPCIQGLLPQWKLEVVSLPNVVLYWEGTWDDIPAYPNLHILMNDLYQIEEKWQCCPGFLPCASLGGHCVDEVIVNQIESNCNKVVPV